MRKHAPADFQPFGSDEVSEMVRCDLCGYVVRLLPGVDLDKLPRPCRRGVGEMLRDVICERGASLPCDRCDELAARLDRLGPDEVSARHAEFVDLIRTNFDELGIFAQLKLAVTSKSSAKLSVISKGIDGAIGEMLDEAIRRARLAASKAGPEKIVGQASRREPSRG